MELNTFIYLAMALFLALLSGKIVKLLKLPNVTGYLVIGLLAGPYCLKLFPADIIDSLALIPEVALAFIAFSIGAEFRLDYLKKIGKAPVIIAFFEAFGAVFVVLAILLALGQDFSFSLVLSAIAAATAPAATLMVVKQYRAKGPVTNTLLPVVAIDDAAALIAFGIAVAIVNAISSGGGSLASTLLSPVWEICGSLVFGGCLGLIFTLLTRYFTGRGNRLAITYALVFLCVGISDIAGFSSLLACMAMSAVYINTSSSKIHQVVFEQTDRMTPPIFMLFFFLSGAQLDISLLPSVGLIGAAYIFFRVIGKILGTALGCRLSHAEPVVQKYLGLTLLPQAGVAIGLATTALTVVPQYGSKIRTIILCGTVIYELIGPLVTRVALSKAGEITLETKKKS